MFLNDGKGDERFKIGLFKWSNNLRGRALKITQGGACVKRKIEVKL